MPSFDIVSKTDLAEVDNALNNMSREMDQRYDFKTPEKAAGQSVRQEVVVREGIEKDLAKKLVKDVKASKIKVQVAIQGDELRVTGKKRDDLQAVIQMLKGLDLDQPLQYVNFRD